MKSKKYKGIILAGGKATRLYPLTKSISKQLLPVYDKPMIYYPLSVLMLADIKDILIISTKEALPQFQQLLGDGSDLGINLNYALQSEPRGLADAFIIGEKFIGNDNVSLILGDNLFFGHGLQELLYEAKSYDDGATVFGYCVKDPERYGVVEFDNQFHVMSLEEKPVKPKSDWAVTGLYFYDNEIVELAKQIKPSDRGEIEITDINKIYLNKNRLKVKLLGRGYAWLDTGTYDSLIDASVFIKTIQERQGLKIGCIEEIAYIQNFISKDQLLSLANRLNTSYGEYLLHVAHE